MNPTNKLRFVERTVETHRYGGDYVVTAKIKVLQQWWEEDSHSMCIDTAGEWRDVPLEEEA